MIIYSRTLSLKPLWLIGVCVFGLNACTPNSSNVNSNAASMPVSTSSPKTTSNEQRIQVVLSWEQLQAQTITAPSAGTIEHLLVQEGQQVQAGQRLAQLTTQAQTQTQTTIKSSLDQAAKAQAYQKWQQDKNLYAQGFISEAALAKSAAAYQAASQSKTVVQNTPITTQTPTSTWLQAPFNGVIKPLAISDGAKVKNGQELFLIKPTDTQRIKILVSQDNHQPLLVGQRLYLYEPKTKQELWLQISELPPIDDKQYVLAYALWPQDLPKPEHLEHYQAYLVTHSTNLP